MARVFVVQQPFRWDPAKGELVPKFDLEPAREHGEIVNLLSPRAAPWSPDSVLAELRHKLDDFSDDDALLLTGNPCLIGWAVAIAADVNGKVRLLQWSGKDQRYLVIDSTVFMED